MAEDRVISISDAVELGLDEVLDLHRRYINEALVDIADGYGIPRRFVKADGIRPWDDAGNEYLDFQCSYGALALGHNHPEVQTAVAQVQDGPNFYVMSLPARASTARASVLCPSPATSNSESHTGRSWPTSLTSPRRCRGSRGSAAFFTGDSCCS